MTRRWIVLLALCGSALSAAPCAAAEGQWIVATAPAFRRAVQPLCEHRKSQGFHVVVIQTSDVLDAGQIRKGDAAKLRDHVHKLCREFKGTSYILLVGAVEAGRSAEPERTLLPAL